MLKCKLIPDLTDVSLAYTNALDKLNDLNLDETTSEGRREFISSALTYLKDNGIVPSQQSLNELTNLLFNYDKNYEDNILGFNTYKSEYTGLIKELWDINNIDEDSKNIAPEANDFPQISIPNINEGLDKIFDTLNDQEKFIKVYQRTLIGFAFVNSELNKLVGSNTDLNNSIISFKTKIFNELADFLKIPNLNMYKSTGFSNSDYSTLIDNAKIYFFPYTKESGFQSDDENITSAYNKFLLLTNFDTFVTKYSSGLINVAKGFFGSHKLPKSGFKYTFDVGKHIKQDYNDEVQGINKHTNEAVKLFINSIPILDSNGKATSQFVDFKEFSALLRIFRNVTRNNVGKIKNLRTNPREAILDIINILKSNRHTYFNGNNSVLYNIFKSIDSAVFDKNNPSSLRSLEGTLTGDSINLYSMIVNHINKTSPINYIQYSYNQETQKYVASFLDSESIAKKQTDFEKNLMLNSKLSDYKDIFSKYSITPIANSDETIDKISFNLGGKSYIYDLSNRELVLNNKKITNFKAEFSNLKNSWSEFLSDLFRSNIDTTFLNTAIEINSDNMLEGIVGVAMSTVINADIAKTGNSLKNLKEKYATSLGSQKEKFYYNKKLDSARIGGLLNSLKGLEAIGKTIAVINKDTTKTQVKNAEKNSLPKERLTSLGNDDIFLFNELIKESRSNPNSIIAQNLFVSNYGLMAGTGLKTFYVNKEGNAKDTFKMQPNELIYSQFVFDFLNLKSSKDSDKSKNEISGAIAVQPDIYSDKSNIWLKLIDLTHKFNFKDIYGNDVVKDKSLEEMSLSEIQQLHFSTMHGMFSRLSETLVNDYTKLFPAIEGVIVNDLGEITDEDYNSLTPEIKNLFEKTTQYVGDGSYESYVVKSLTIEDFIPLISKLNTESVYQGIRNLNKNNINITILPEIHFVQGKKGSSFNTNLYENIKTYSLKDKSKETTINNISDLFYERKAEQDKLYAHTLNDNGVRFDLYDDYGSEVKSITNNIDFSLKDNSLIPNLNKNAKTKLFTKLGIKDSSTDFKNIWINNKTKSLINYYILDNEGNIIEEPIDLLENVTNKNYKVVLNPYLQEFKTIDGLITDNYNAATVGLPQLHPAKGAATNNDSDRDSKLHEEAARTSAMGKRGVIFGATIHPFIQGKFNGIQDKYKIAVIEDFKTPVINVQGDSDNATQWDGGIFLNPITARNEQSSLEELQLSPIHRKPIGYYSLSNYLSSGLLKCATFTVTNEFIRNGQSGKVLGDTLMKQLNDFTWEIPNLDITKDYNGNKISYNGFIYQDINTRKKWLITDIKKIYPTGFDENGKLNNSYEITRQELDSNGTFLKLDGSNITNTIIKDISSNYDLWSVLGGAFSMKRVGNTLEYSEDSLDKLTSVANLVAFNKNTYYDNILIKELGNKAPKIYKSNSNDISQNTYYQPMKFSKVDYLATAGAVKNGMGNVNPGRLLENGYNPNIQSLKDSDRVIYGHPAIGKTYAKARHDSFLSFDDDYGNAIKNFIDKRLKEEQTRLDYKKEAPEEYKQFLLGLYETAKARANDEGKRFFFSDQVLLKALDEAGKLEEINRALSLGVNEFVQRDKERGGVDEANTRDWKKNIDFYLNKLSDRTVDIGRTHLLDILDNTNKKHQRSQLTYINIKPDYIGIQLNAEHNVDNAETSEMTQVMSALEQMSTTHDNANSVFNDIGKVISKGLKDYNFNENSEEEKSEVYKILGRNLVKTVLADNQVGLANSFLKLVKKDVESNKLLSNMKYKIPFDDNNIFGMFTTGFTNSINKDIIRRKYSGLQAILNPSYDIVTVYDNPNGSVMKYTDILNTTDNIDQENQLFDSMNANKDIAEVRTGDWIELDGNLLLVTNYRNDSNGKIGLLNLRDLRITNNLKQVKVIGSKGRNLRGANHIITLESPIKGFTKFDAFDLDSSKLSWFLSDKNWRDKLKNSLNDENNELGLAWKDISERIFDKYNIEITPDIHQTTMLGYLRDLIYDDLNDIHNGNFRIPIMFREGENIFAKVNDVRYDPNELAIGKNTASKFGLKLGDNLFDITNQGYQFFSNRQEDIIYTDVYPSSYDMYFVKNNRDHLHVLLNTDVNSEKIKSLINLGKLVEDLSINTRVKNGDTYLIENGEMVYKFDPENTKFYNYISGSGESRKFIITSNVDTILNIDQSKLYSNAVFNYNGNNISTLLNIQSQSYFTPREDQTLLSDTLEELKTANTDNEKQELAEDLNYINDSSMLNRIDHISKEIYQSWQEAMKFIVARIPSQSMQSFMNMKVALFTESETNICYIPVEQIWYQGSDFKPKMSL